MLQAKLPLGWLIFHVRVSLQDPVTPHLWSNFWLMCLGGNKCYSKYLCHCHICRRSKWSSCILVWLGLGFCGHLGSELADGTSLFLFLSALLSITLPFRERNFRNKKRYKTIHYILLYENQWKRICICLNVYTKSLKVIFEIFTLFDSGRPGGETGRFCTAHFFCI